MQALGGLPGRRPGGKESRPSPPPGRPLAASGTVALELGLAGVPAVIAYKVNPVSAWLAYRLVKLKYVSLINLILRARSCRNFAGAGFGRVYPAKLQDLLADTPAAACNWQRAAKWRHCCAPEGRDSSEIAAAVVLSEMRPAE